MNRGTWRYRVVGRPDRKPDEPFFVVRYNAWNNRAYGPFTNYSFPFSRRIGGKPMIEEHRRAVALAIAAFIPPVKVLAC